MKKNCLFLLLSILTISLATMVYGRNIEDTKRIGKVSLNSTDTLPNYYYQLPLLDADFNFSHYATLGDVNGDGFSDIGVVASVAKPGSSKYGYTILLVYHGSSSGLQSTPDKIINLIRFPLSRTSIVNGIGDVNGDGYDDVYFWEDIYFGSADGLNSTFGWELYRDPNNYSREMYYNSMDGRAFPAGDLNNDGYADFLAPASDMGELLIFLGGSPLKNTPTISFWMGLDDFANLIGLAAGDLNGDGYDDFIFHGYDDYANAYAYLGAPRGYDPRFVWQHFKVQRYYSSRDITIADVNGDGYNDINVHVLYDEPRESLETLLTIYGSAAGPDLANPDTLYKKYVNNFGQLTRLYAIGDINRDGYEDIQVTPTPSRYSDEIPIEPHILYGSDSGLVNKPDFYYKEFHHMQQAGDINGDGYPDFTAEHGDDKSLVILYSKEAIPDSPPVLTCLPELKFCYDSSGNYTIPEPEIGGEVKSIHYSIQGSTRRSGNGMNASGYFKPGSSSIIWSVTAMNDQVITCTTKVLVSNPISVYIKPGVAHPQGAVPGEIYLGYGADSYRIVAIPSGNSGPYTYKWSDGSTEKFTRIRHNSVGSFPYHVELTNRDGCKANAAYTIQVKNVRCISPLEDLFAKFFPSLYKEPAILNLFHNAAEIQLCKEGKTFCSPKSKVAALLNQGATLGSCAVTIPETVGNTLKAAPIPEHAGLDVQVYPNPSRSNFRFLIQGPRNTGQIIILTLSGQQLERINYFSGNVIEIGSALKAGTYIAEVISGNERKVLKLVKLQ